MTFPFIPLVEIDQEKIKKIHLMFGYIMAEDTIGIGDLCWIDEFGKKVEKAFQIDCVTYEEETKCFRVATLEEAQELFEMKRRTSEKQRRFKVLGFRKKTEEQTLTLVRCMAGGYVLWNKEEGKIEEYIAITTKKEDYSQYREGKLYARGLTVVVQ